MKFLSDKKLVGQFSRYLITGGLAFIVDFGLFALFLYAFKWHYLLANLVALLGGLTLNYLISIFWVFVSCHRVVQSRGAEFLVFAVIGFAGVGFNQLIMYLLVGQGNVHEMLSKAIAAGIVLLWNFGARKFFLFRSVKEMV